MSTGDLGLVLGLTVSVVGLALPSLPSLGSLGS
jgi:hypothetical protein